jgi:hypothetical protein
MARSVFDPFTRNFFSANGALQVTEWQRGDADAIKRLVRDQVRVAFDRANALGQVLRAWIGSCGLIRSSMPAHWPQAPTSVRPRMKQRLWMSPVGPLR